jgi:hypothetical protein
MTTRQAEEVIKQQAQTLEDLKLYLLRRWDKLSPVGEIFGLIEVSQVSRPHWVS